MSLMDTLVPHRGRMSWLDRLVEAGPEHAVCEAVIGPEHLLQRDGLLSAAAGLEYMAQAVAAWAGSQRPAGTPPRIGFLLGTRRYTCARDFRVGERLRIRVQRQYQAENGLGQFDAHIEIDAQLMASASLNVFGPDDPAAFLAEPRNGS